jgi:hypothetical protein
MRILAHSVRVCNMPTEHHPAGRCVAMEGRPSARQACCCLRDILDSQHFGASLVPFTTCLRPRSITWQHRAWRAHIRAHLTCRCTHAPSAACHNSTRVTWRICLHNLSHDMRSVPGSVFSSSTLVLDVNCLFAVAAGGDLGSGQWRPAAASLLWLHHALDSLNRDLISRSAAPVLAQ